jgi:hypothetical protein
MATRLGLEERFAALAASAKNQVERRTGKTTAQLYAESEKRLTDVIELKEPDRVPVMWRGEKFVFKHSGVSPSAQFYDSFAYKEAIIKTFLDLEIEADAIHDNVASVTSGRAMEMLGEKQFVWPGGALRPDQSPQFLDAEMMKEDEYDLFMTDPTDFMIRYYLPRRFKALEDSFSKLRPLAHSFWGATPGLVRISPAFATPGFQKAAEALKLAGREQEQFSNWGEGISQILGIPPLTYPGGVGNMPFDILASDLRGMRGVMVDMIKQPEKLIAASEKVLEWRLARATRSNPPGRRTTGSSNHYASEDFMSKKQFEKFCWPTWKKSILATIDLGYVNWSYLEGKCDGYLEHFLELPKGKAFIGFEKVDVFRAKEILGHHMCIAGGVPASLMWAGSPQEVEDYCERLIKVCGKGGGFILACSVSLDDAKPANVKAMYDSVKKYGRYH